MELFRELLSTTSPSGKEQEVQKIVQRELDKHGVKHVMDKYGNIWTKIGDKPPTLFTGHMDCVHNDHPVILDESVDGVISLHKDSKQRALGADDTVGVRMMLKLIEAGTEALYIFTVEEEIGCCGAKFAADFCPDYIRQAITFDRKGTGSVITSMSGGPCCSDEFADALITELDMGHTKDPTGSITDTEKFRIHTLNHTNISAGYYSEHTTKEWVDVDYVAELMEHIVKVDWDALPQTKRPARPAYSYPKYGYSRGAIRSINIKTMNDAIMNAQDVEQGIAIVLDHIENATTSGVYLYKNELCDFLESIALLRICEDFNDLWDGTAADDTQVN